MFSVEIRQRMLIRESFGQRVDVFNFYLGQLIEISPTYRSAKGFLPKLIHRNRLIFFGLSNMQTRYATT